MVSVGFFVIFGLGGYYVFKGDIQVGTMLAFISMFGFLIDPTTTLASVFGTIQEVKQNSKRVHELLELEEERYGELKISEIQNNCVNELQFKNVAFGYEDKKIIDNINWTIESNQNVLIKGDNGTGKSSLVQLLLKLYSPWEGEILYKKTDIEQLDNQQWRDLIAYVPQKPRLISGTVAENIAMSNQNIDMKVVKKAAKAVSAHEFIIELPEGYNTILGTSNINLSEGEKQRICIARAIMKDSEIVICDELFSSIDVENRTNIIKSLLNLFDSKILIIISHEELDISFDKVLTLNNSITIKTNRGGIINEE